MSRPKLLLVIGVGLVLAGALVAALVIKSLVGSPDTPATEAAPSITAEPAAAQLPAARTLTYDAQGICHSRLYPDNTTEWSFVCHLYEHGNRVVLNSPEEQLVMAGRWNCQQLHLLGVEAIPRLVAGAVSEGYSQAEGQDLVKTSIGHFCTELYPYVP